MTFGDLRPGDIIEYQRIGMKSKMRMIRYVLFVDTEIIIGFKKGDCFSANPSVTLPENSFIKSSANSKGRVG